MKAENKGKLVRGVVIAGNRYKTGCVPGDLKDAEKYGCIAGFTHWFRHDEDLTVLDRELKDLADCFGRMQKTDCYSVGYEYKDYER